MRRTVYSLGVYLAGFAYGSLLVVFWVVDQDFASAAYEHWPSFALVALKSVQESSWLAVSVLVILKVVSYYRNLMTRPATRELLQVILDEAQKYHYPAAANQHLHQHRITLFKYKKWCWKMWNKRDWEESSLFWPWGKGRRPWSGWLVPEYRSGHTSQRTKTVFLAPDDGEAEGVCGLAWAADSVIVKPGLPNLTSNLSRSNIDRYVRNSRSSEAMVRTRLDQGVIPPRSIGAIPVKVGGQIWGVLCLDSVDPNGVPGDVGSELTLTIEIVQKVLEEA